MSAEYSSATGGGGREAGTAKAPGTAIPLRAYYALGLLVLVYFSNGMDRMIVAVLLEPIRQEFGLSDGQAGLLAGLAFAITNAIAAVPFGLAADRFKRSTVVAGAIAFWSAMTVLCGLAQNFVQLLLARAAVGFGEAGGPAPSAALVGDLFPAERRASAMSVLFAAGPIGAALALAIGGWVAQHFGWRAAFWVAGAPGLLLALLLWLTVREPPRQAQAAEAPPGLAAVFRLILGQPALLHAMAGLAVGTFVMAGLGSWMPAFFIRSHGVSLAVAGSVLALTHGVMAVIGNLLAGVLTDVLARRDPRWRAWTIALALVVATPLLAGLLLAPSWPLTLLIYGLHTLFEQMFFGPGYALCQGLVQPRMRATVSSLLYLAAGLIGFGLGTQFVGSVSDAFAGSGPDSLRYALLTLCLFRLWAAAHLWAAGRRLDLKAP